MRPSRLARACLLAGAAALGATLHLAGCSDFSSSATDAGATAEASAVSDAGATYRSLVVADKPLVYWRMGTPIAMHIVDEMGTGNDLVLAGNASSFTTGIPGALTGDDDRAIHFVGTNGRAEAINGAAFDFPAGHPFTLEAWARRMKAATGSPYSHIISHASGVLSVRAGFLLYVTTEMVDGGPTGTHFEYDATGDQHATDSNIVPAGVWAHYVAVFDGKTATLYTDGVPGASSAVATPFAITPMTKLVVGANNANSSVFAGDIDEVAIYDRALTLAQVVAHRTTALRPP